MSYQKCRRFSVHHSLIFTDLNFFDLDSSCLVYKNICLLICPFFAYEYLKINFNPLVCCCMKPFMQARKSRRDVTEDSGGEGNFCCSNIGPLIAESGNMIPGTCNLGHNFFRYWTQLKF